MTKEPTGKKGYGTFDAPHEDLRDWLERVDGIGELLRVEGVDWNLEMGSVAEMIYHAKPDNPPAILFEKIPGFPDDYRVLSGATNSPRRLAVTLGFPMPEHPLDVVQSYRDRLENFEELPPREVNLGPILENVDRDGEVDLYKFPVPLPPRARRWALYRHRRPGDYAGSRKRLGQSWHLSGYGP